jgi:ribosomal protein S18 acetylase RimI-like enzyme
MDEPSIQLYDEDHRGAVLDVLTDAYLTNPINMAVFGGRGPEEARQNRALFSAFIEILEGPRFVALQEGSVVGYVQWVSHPGCRPSGPKAASIMPRLLNELADGVAPRLTTWLRTWRERDPDVPHSHFGPIAVSPSRQGTGVGRLLMQHYCRQLDLAMESGYLETDRPENVEFYGKSGFEVTSEIEVLGVRNWFMRRPARAA